MGVSVVLLVERVKVAEERVREGWEFAGSVSVKGGGGSECSEKRAKSSSMDGGADMAKLLVIASAASAASVASASLGFLFYVRSTQLLYTADIDKGPQHRNLTLTYSKSTQLCTFFPASNDHSTSK